jgi:hypothetical protein
MASRGRAFTFSCRLPILVSLLHGSARRQQTFSEVLLIRNRFGLPESHSYTSLFRPFRKSFWRASPGDFSGEMPPYIQLLSDTPTFWRSMIGCP